MGEKNNESANELSREKINAAYIVGDEKGIIVDGKGNSKFIDIDDEFISIKYDSREQELGEENIR